MDLFPASLFNDEADSLTEKRIAAIKCGDLNLIKGDISAIERCSLKVLTVPLADTWFILTARRLYPKFWPEQEGQNLEIEIEILADQIRSLAFCIGFIGIFGLMLLSILG